jgi:hypothetical protein
VRDDDAVTIGDVLTRLAEHVSAEVLRARRAQRRLISGGYRIKLPKINGKFPPDWASSLACEVAIHLCIDNRGYEASPGPNKVHLAIRDERGDQTGDGRIVDESGEDDLYAKKRFVPIEVPAQMCGP